MHNLVLTHLRKIAPSELEWDTALTAGLAESKALIFENLIYGLILKLKIALLRLVF